MKALLAALSVSLSILLVACGGGSMTVSTPPITVSISTSASSATLLTGASQTFTVTVTGTSNTSVAWSIQEGAAGGTIDAAGKYTAPTVPGTFHIIATSMADPTKTVMITVIVIVPVAVVVSPASVTVVQGASQQFAATVTGTADSAVTWSIQEGNAGGTIDTTGKYTAPNTAGTFHVIATSVADATKSATASVTVIAPVAIAISPATVALNTGATQAFTAIVTGTSNTAVVWSVQEGTSGGTIDTTGKYTAPNTAGTFHVIATSVADATKSATATVAVSPPHNPVSISISPSFVSLTQSGTQLFVPSFAGTANTAVTWSVVEGSIGGSVDSNGKYTAPLTNGNFHVMATSVVDPSKSATATAVVIGVAPTYVFSLDPMFVEMRPNTKQQFTLTMIGTFNSPVVWEVVPSTGGTVDSTGLFTASSETGTVYVRATVASPSAGAAAIVTVTNTPTPLGISMSPSTVNLLGRAAQQFTVSLSGSARDSNVTKIWSVQEGPDGGIIDADGRYVAPQSVGTFHVVVNVPSLNLTATSAVNVTALATGFFSDAVRTDSIYIPSDLSASSVTQLSDGSILSVGGLTWMSTLIGGYLVASNLALDFQPSPDGTITASTVGNSVTGLANHSAVLLQDGRVLVAGGSIQSPSSISISDTATAELFNPQSKTFTATGSMSVPRRDFSIVRLLDGSVLVAGLELVTPSPSVPASSAEIYDPKTGTFVSKISIAPFRESAATALLPDGRVLFAGGYFLGTDGATDLSTATAEIFDPTRKAFSPTGSMFAGRAGATATALPDGTVLVEGGYSTTGGVGTGNWLPSAEIYDPRTGSFSPAGNMFEALHRHGAILLPSGQVLVIGGGSRIAELYDPQTRTFKPAAESYVPHAGRGLFLMPNGTVLVTDGPSDHFEFYHP